MNKLLTSDNFTVAATAMASVGMGIFVKIASRRDQHKFISRNDFAVGLDLMISAIIIVTTRSSDPEHRISAWGLLFLFFIPWTISTMVRKYGWEKEDQLKFGAGVLIPDAIGIIFLFTVVYYT